MNEASQSKMTSESGIVAEECDALSFQGVLVRIQQFLGDIEIAINALPAPSWRRKLIPAAFSRAEPPQENCLRRMPIYADGMAAALGYMNTPNAKTRDHLLSSLFTAKQLPDSDLSQSFVSLLEIAVKADKIDSQSSPCIFRFLLTQQIRCLNRPTLQANPLMSLAHDEALRSDEPFIEPDRVLLLDAIKVTRMIAGAFVGDSQTPIEQRLVSMADEINKIVRPPQYKTNHVPCLYNALDMIGRARGPDVPEALPTASA